MPQMPTMFETIRSSVRQTVTTSSTDLTLCLARPSAALLRAVCRLGQLIVTVRESPPARPRNRETSGGTTICSVRGSIIRVTTGWVCRFRVVVVLDRLWSMVTTFVCMTLVTKVLAHSDSVSSSMIKLPLRPTLLVKPKLCSLGAIRRSLNSCDSVTSGIRHSVSATY